jgi:hypothetical protein
MSKLVISPVENKGELKGGSKKYYFDAREHRAYFSEDLHRELGLYMDMPYLTKDSKYANYELENDSGDIVITTLD